MKITLIGQDAAPSQVLHLLAGALQAAGHTTSEFLAQSKMSSTAVDHAEAIGGSQALVLGMSSSVALASEELAAATFARTSGVPVFFIADTFGVHNRPWFKELLEGQTLFHISEAQAEAARQVLPDTNVIATGNPAWEEFFYPKKTRTQVREMLGYDDEARLILVPGGKSLEVNTLHFKKAAEIARASGATALISLHPGDKNSVEAYEGSIGTGMHIRFIPASVMKGSEILPGVDWVLESASGIGVEAACQRIPIFTWFSPAAKARLKEATGSEEWPLCTEGVSCLLPEDFSGSLVEIDHKSYSDRAVEFFQPPAERGEALKKMVKAVTGQ